MSTLPIRIRLSLWYFAMFASASALLSITSMWMLGRSVDATEYHELQERAEDVQLVLQHQDPQHRASIHSETALLPSTASKTMANICR
jgi:sensor domain CHASE-containing protein